ncbi:MAG TPA: magnesium transporter [Bacillota bacterium]|nr:magnesium transporter [Bacillota bacterium]
MNLEKISEMLSKKNYNEIRNVFKDVDEVDIADILDKFDAKTTLILFRLLPKEKAADVFTNLSIDQKTEISMLVNDKELTSILNDLFFDDKIDYLEEMPASVVKRILINASENERRLINQFLNYPEDSAGSLMTIEFVDLKREMHVSAALERIRRIGLDKETIYTCYVIDSKRRLEGTVSLKNLVFAPADNTVGDIMKQDPIVLHTHDDQELTADIFKRYDLLAAPVVDQENRLVGIITIDDIIDVIDEENTEDFHRMAALQPTREEYLESGVLSLAKKRIPWLLVLMISATFTGYIIQRYEKSLESVVALAVFIPMLMNTGGNAGSQASTLVIRGLALGELEFKHTFKILWKEIRVSLLVGTSLAAVNFLRTYYLEGYPIDIATTVSLTILVTIVTAKVIGSVLPILAKQLKMDPAIMASPLITTIVDAVALIVYFTFATRILGL